jgi:hypothetical protein
VLHCSCFVLHAASFAACVAVAMLAFNARSELHEMTTTLQVCLYGLAAAATAAAAAAAGGAWPVNAASADASST